MSANCPACGAPVTPGSAVCPNCLTNFNGPKPDVHLSPDGGIQAYVEPYPPLHRGVALHLAFIPGREIVQVLETRGEWVRVSVNGQVAGWVNGRSLHPPIGRTFTGYDPNNPIPGTRGAKSRVIAVDVLVGAIAAIGIIVGALVDWTQGLVAVNSFKIPVAFLFDPKTRAHDPRIGYFLVVIGLLGVLVSFISDSGPWRVALGLFALIIAFVYCAQVAAQLSDLPGSASFTDVVGGGPWITGIAGTTLALSPLFRSKL